MMTFDRSALSIAAIAITVSALMHLVVPVLSGFAPGTPILLVFFVLYLAIAWGLMRKMRWLAWLTFLWMIVGMAAAISGAMTGPVNWAYAIMALANIVTFVSLFIALWHPKAVAQA